MSSFDDFVLGKEQKTEEGQPAQDSLEDLVLSNAQKVTEERAREEQRQREEQSNAMRAAEARAQTAREEAQASARRVAEAEIRATRAEAEARAATEREAEARWSAREEQRQREEQANALRVAPVERARTVPGASDVSVQSVINEGEDSLFIPVKQIEQPVKSAVITKEQQQGSLSAKLIQEFQKRVNEREAPRE
jgi:hypothetical protein